MLHAAALSSKLAGLHQAEVTIYNDAVEGGCHGACKFIIMSVSREEHEAQQETRCSGGVKTDSTECWKQQWVLISHPFSIRVYRKLVRK